MSNKMNLTEATLLALQGKLKLDESVEVEVDDTEVTVSDNNTVIETPNETVIINTKTEECSTECEDPVSEIDTQSDIAPEDITVQPAEVEEVEDTLPVETPNEVEDVETEVEETVTESKNLTESFNTFNEFKQEVDKYGGLYGYVANTVTDTLLREITLNALYELDNDQVVMDDIKDRVFNNVEESKQCTSKVNLKSFEEKLNEYFSNKNSIKSVKIEKVLKNSKSIKLECELIDNEDNTSKDEIILDKVQEGKYFTKYSCRSTKSKITESINTKSPLSITTFLNNNTSNVLYCAKLNK